METAPNAAIDMTWFFVFLAGGLLLFALSIILRATSGGKYDIRPVDLILVLVPVFLWLFATGKITKFNIAGVEMETTAEAFLSATEQPIDFASLPASESSIDDVMQNVEMARKTGVQEIPNLIRKKTEALEFKLGFGGYWGPAIEKYFETLGTAGFLKYVIIYDRERDLFGVYAAPPLLIFLQNEGAKGYESFARALNRADAKARQRLQGLPGFIGVADGVTPKTSKQKALETMERIDASFLPVVDETKRFKGILHRDRIISSLIIEVTKAMERLRPAAE
jgi:CBS domain-containing protein